MDTLTADVLAETLQELKKALLAKVLRTIGPERCAATLTLGKQMCKIPDESC